MDTFRSYRVVPDFRGVRLEWYRVVPECSVYQRLVISGRFRRSVGYFYVISCCPESSGSDKFKISSRLERLGLSAVVGFGARRNNGVVPGFAIRVDPKY